MIRGDQRVHLLLERDGFARDVPIVVADDLARLDFTIEDRAGRAHETTVTIAGLPAGRYEISAAGRRVATVDGGSDGRVSLRIDGMTNITVVKRARD
ncbi:MAG TPA: hypothetical protein VFJ02_24280 [Vicinamibacterales bacterium]|nr:hypothetical protein [Vicinamibacterales bacterium]